MASGLSSRTLLLKRWAAALTNLGSRHGAAEALKAMGPIAEPYVIPFADSHDVALMHDPKILDQRAKVSLTGDEKLMDPAAPRGAIVEVTLVDGRKVDHFTRFPPGTRENPLDTEAVSAKARDLMAPVLGSEKTERLIDQVNNLERVDDVRMLRALFAI